MIGIALLAVFGVCAVLMFARVLPALLAVPLMALAIAALAGGGWPGLASVVVDGSVKLAPVFVTVIFGALLSRVTLSTGIAETIVNYAAEFGGDRPMVVALALSAAVAFLFTSLTGLGAIIMVGSIVLPIMMTIGVPRRTAATLFMLAFALGFIFNLTQWTFYTKTFDVTRAQLQPYALVLAGLQLAVLLVYVAVRFRSSRGYATWALAAPEPVARRRAPAWSLITPVLPIVLYFVFGVSPIVAFALSALYGVLVTRPRDAVATLVASAIRGIEDVAPAVLLFMGIGMLLVATGLPAVKAELAPVVAAIAPRNWFAYVLLFGVLSPLALYRGPLNPFGVGIGVYTVLAGLGILPPVTLVAAVMAVVQVQNVCDPTNTQNVWVANFTGVRVDEITKLTLPFQVTVATAAVLCVVLFGASLFGAPVFRVGTPAAAATLELPGLFSPPSAARTIALGSDGTRTSLEALEEIEREIGRGWPGFRVMRAAADPSASDCAQKPYAAFLRVRSTEWSGETPGMDVGLELADCAGYPVDQWHEVRPLAGGDAPSSARRAGLATLFRFRTWTIEHPSLAAQLFEHGLAYDRASAGPTYLFSLFKTTDGQMRAYVRPGGPAYAVGLRTNDIVEKLDGKFWWEYGTFQTQKRAYDGLPHTFVVTRGAAELTIALGDPY